MDEILHRLQALSADELRAEVVGAGLKCGPITATTRALFEKKLASALLVNEKGGGSVPEADSPRSVTSDPCSASPDRLAHGLGDEGDFGYGVGLNPPDEEALSGTFATTQCVGLGDGTPEHNPESPLHFYGVCPGPEDGPVDNDRVHVYVNKHEALRALKTMRGARFKMFSSREDAEKFSKGANDLCPSPSKTMTDEFPGKPELEALNCERANAFKAPRTQDLTAKLRKAVEKGDQEAFKELVWSNPRYLIGSGDNPTIVQEGCRYNVMHVAAKENQAGIAQLLLNTLEDPEFMRLMYPDDQDDMLRKRIRYIVDLYLNTPDKAAFETPLHFACKFGCPDVVNVLCSHPDTDKYCKNKYNQKPLSVICERKNKTQEMKQKIRDYFEDRYYIPLLRAADNSSQPVIGAPCSPDLLDPVPHWSGPEISGSPKDPVMIIRAFAGPLCQSKAEEFRKMWKTPPKDRASYFHHILKSDPDRGAERVGRELAHEFGYLWAEYWEFLGTFVDLSTVAGLEVLEDYLKRKEHSVASLDDAKKRKAGISQNISNSISVGAFLDDDSDVTLEDSSEESRQVTDLKTLLMSCVTGSPEEVTPDKDPCPTGQESPCSPGHDEGKTRNLGTLGRSSASDGSPVSNLLAQFEKVSKLVANREWEDTSSTSSEDYFTAEESDDGAEDEAGTPGLNRARAALRDRDENDVDSLGSSSSSYKSLHDSEEDLTPKTPPLTGRGLFIEGESPTKLDSEVLYAVKVVEIDPQQYPCVEKWRSTIQGFTSTQMQSWPSPARMKHSLGTPSPGSPCHRTLSPGTPAHCSPTHASLLHRLCQSHL